MYHNFSPAKEGLQKNAYANVWLKCAHVTTAPNRLYTYGENSSLHLHNFDEILLLSFVVLALKYNRKTETCFLLQI